MDNDEKGTALGDRIGLRGCYEIGVYDPDGNLLQYRKVENIVVTSGRSYVLSRLVSNAPQTDVINAIEVGTSTTAPTTADLLLNGTYATASGGTGRLAIASFVVTGLSVSPPSWQAQVTFATNQANTTLGEAGIFNATGYNASTMLSHVTFATINKASTNTLAISYTISN